MYKQSKGQEEVWRDGLQEVVTGSTASCGNSTLLFGDSAEDAELGVEVLADVHDGSYIATTVAVVGRGPDGNDGFLSEMKLY